jgi:WD40 repeat protein
MVTIMKKFVLLVFLLSVSFAYSQHLVKPDTLWTYGPAKFTSYPAVHPNGNVLVRIGFDVHELNGSTGELIRKIHIPVGTSSIGRIDVSTDGTKLLAGGYFIDYNSGELIRTLPNNYRYCFLHPFNDVIMFIQPWGTEPISDSTLRRYNLSTSEEIPIRTDFPVTSLEVSNDGKYLAIGCLELNPEERTHFYLYDAQTLKLIRGLEDVPSTGRRIEFIQFSETAKYVGYGHLSSGYAKATYFSCPNPTIKKEFNCPSLGLIKDNYAFVLCGGSFLWDIDSKKEIYRTLDYLSNYPIYNRIYNSVMVFSMSGKLVALDLDAVLSGVDIREDFNTDSLTITYQNGYLQISNIESTSAPIDINLFDLHGKMIYKSIQPIIEDSLQIGIDLQSGVYILQLQAGDKQYSQKFIISN